MDRKILLLVVSILWLMPRVGEGIGYAERGGYASAVEVVRLIPMAGAAQDVPVASLQKIVFTADSIVFVPANAGQVNAGQANEDVPRAVYKYDYRTMLFVATEPMDVENTGVSEVGKSVKFIQNGRLYIRRDNRIYDVLGNLKD